MPGPLADARVSAPILVAATLLLIVPTHAVERVAEPPGVERLKQTYLTCAQVATGRRLTHAEAAACSQIADELLQRGFHGDLDRLLAWWRAARTEETTR